MEPPTIHGQASLLKNAKSAHYDSFCTSMSNYSHVSTCVPKNRVYTYST